MKILRKEINYLVQLTEAILQFRLERKKGQLQHLNTLRSEIKKSYRFNTFNQSIMESMVDQESYQIRNKFYEHGLGKFSEPNSSVRVSLVFQVIEKSQCVVVNEERWMFSLKWASPQHIPDKKESNWAMMDLIDHTIRHLIYYELIPRKERKYGRNKYMIDYKLEIGYPKLPDSKVHKNMWNRHTYSLGSSVQEVFHLECSCYYNEHHISEFNKENDAPITQSKQVHKNSDSTSGTGRKVSLFEYWDEELETLVLSGSKSYGKDKVSEVCLDVNDSEDEFQLLIEEAKSHSETFIKENGKMLEQMSQMESQYNVPM